MMAMMVNSRRAITSNFIFMATTPFDESAGASERVGMSDDNEPEGKA